MHSWYHLNISIADALNRNSPFRWPMPFFKNMVFHFRGDHIFEALNKQWLEQFADLGYPITELLIFWKVDFHPFEYMAHVDINTLNSSQLSHSAFNIVIGGCDSTMNFYKLPNDKKPIKYITSNSPYKEWHVIDDKLELLDVLDDYSKIVMVRVDLPHAIITKEWPRLCFSFRSQPASDYPWDYVVADFTKHGLLIPRD